MCWDACVAFGFEMDLKGCYEINAILNYNKVNVVFESLIFKCYWSVELSFQKTFKLYDVDFRWHDLRTMLTINTIEIEQ